jgi:N-acetylated-alpha-linked acidic dipeptidase
MSLDFEELEEAIQHLQSASERMDRQKEKAERKLRKLLRKRKWRRWMMRSCCEDSEEDEARLLHGFSRGHRRGKKWRRAVRRVRAVNQKLVAFERGFMNEDGIKGREWHRNLAFAPGKYLGVSNLSVSFFFFC